MAKPDLDSRPYRASCLIRRPRSRQRRRRAPAHSKTPRPPRSPSSRATANCFWTTAVAPRFRGLNSRPAGGGAHKRLSQWLAGQDVFIRAFSGASDRWGRTPAALFAAQGSDAAAPIVSVGTALLEEGLARFRPDPPSAPCAAEYRAAETIARDARRGIWVDAAMLPVSAGEGARSLLQRKGMVILEGKISSFGELRGLVFLNFGQSVNRR